MAEVHRIGKYEILEELGRGGFATVYKARDTTLDRIVALKVLHPYWMQDPNFAARFRQEARAAANLRHPNIVTVYDADEVTGQLYIAMEYLPGRTLHDLLEAQGALSVERALPILEQIAAALDYAHERGVIHRDIKPLNVMVEDAASGPRVTLMDFGLVKALESSTALTSQGTLLGSPEYMAPEQADPDRVAEIGPATDRYALGIVAYQMLAGRVPFLGNTPGTLNAHLNLEPPDPRRFVADLPPDVTTVLLTMLAKAPADRFPTALAFVEQLKEIAEGRKPAPPLPPWLKPVGIGLAVIVLGVLGRLLWWAVFPTSTPTPTPTFTPTRQPPMKTFTPMTTPWPGEATDTPEPPPPTMEAPTDTPTPPIDASSPPVCTTAGAIWTRPTDGMTLLCVPDGTFPMGSESGADDEKSVHPVTLSAFWIDRMEVTNAQYRECVEAGECVAPTTCDWGDPTYDDADKSDHPVVCVNWQGAVDYCTWAGAQLPTEAQWEYAARGPEGYVYPWGNDWREKVANCVESDCEDGYEYTAPVGSFLEGKSWVGALDMGGNVGEWTADWYVDSYPSEHQTDPQGPTEGPDKVVRGGSWYYDESYLRAANRGRLTPAYTVSARGFRCLVRAQD